LGRDFDGDEQAFSDEEWASVIFVNNYIFHHKVLRVNYTTYDMRRGQDSINPRTHADVIVLAHEDDDPENNLKPHPFWYARIIGIFHAQVRHVGPNSTSKEPR
jgi:hypothetical protein